jgi:phage terminase small subunit
MSSHLGIFSLHKVIIQMTGQPNRSGGARAGAGRPHKAPQLLDLGEPEGVPLEPLAFLLAVMNCPQADTRVRIEAAKAAAPYVHAKKDGGGKKEQQQAAATVASSGRFAPLALPRLVAGKT